MRVLASVVIPAHNAAHQISGQLEALAGQVDAPDFEVILVLNRCTDATGEVAARFKARLPLTILRADEKASASYARNAGAAVARGEVLLFCDADDRVGTRWVAGMLCAFDGGADIVGGVVIIDRDGLPDWAYREFYEWMDGLYLDSAEHDILPVAGSMAVRKRTFVAVGGFDESLATCEDSDLAVRIVTEGGRRGIAHDATILCRPRITVRSILAQRRWYAKGDAQFARKMGNLRCPPPRLVEMWRTSKWLLMLMIRRRVWRPSELYVRLVVRCARENARRREWKLHRNVGLSGSKR